MIESSNGRINLIICLQFFYNVHISYTDVGMGGFFYWVWGHAFAYGNNPTYATPFNGFGGFFFDADEREHFAGIAYLHFFYQMGNSFEKSFPKVAISKSIFLGLCSLSTSISSGAMQERANFRAMILFSCFNIFCFAFPAHWMWSDIGFLKGLGAIDCAGSGSIHIAGGFSGMF